MKRVVAIIISMILIISLSACSDSNQSQTTTNYANLDRFTLQEKIVSSEDKRDWDAIYVDSKTGVLYFVHHDGKDNGNSVEWCTVLLGSDGLPLLADGYERKTN